MRNDGDKRRVTVREEAEALHDRFGRSAGTQVASLIAASMLDEDEQAIERFAAVAVELEAVFRERGFGSLED